MSTNNQKLSIVIEAVDQFSGILKNLKKGVSNTATLTAKELQSRVVGAYQQIGQSGTVTLNSLNTNTLKLSQTTNVLGNTIRSVDRASKFEMFRRSIAAIDDAISVVTEGISKMAQAFSIFSDFEQRMAEVNTLLEVSGKQFNSLKDAVVDISTKVPESASNLASGLYDLISSGATFEEAPKALEAAAKAAKAGVTDTKTAVLGLMGTINAYGLSVSDMDKISDKFFKTIKLGVTNFEALASQLGGVTQTAKTAGLSIEEVLASIATMTKVGIQTPQAVTALNSSLIQLKAPGAQAKETMRQLGIEFTNFTDVVRQFASKKLSLAQIRDLIPDVEGAKGILALSQNFELFKKTLDEVNSSAGATQAAFDKMKDTPSNEIRLLTNELQALFIELGEKLQSEIISIIQTLKDFFSIIGDVALAMVSLKDLNFFKDLQTLSKAPFDFLVSGLEGIALGFKDLIPNAENFASVFTAVFEAIKNTLKDIPGLGFIADLFDGLLEDGESFWQNFTKMVATGVLKIRKLLVDLKIVIYETFQDIKNNDWLFVGPTAGVKVAVELAYSEGDLELSISALKEQKAELEKSTTAILNMKDATKQLNDANQENISSAKKQVDTLNQLKESAQALQKDIAGMEKLYEQQSVEIGVNLQASETHPKEIAKQLLALQGKYYNNALKSTEKFIKETNTLLDTQINDLTEHVERTGQEIERLEEVYGQQQEMLSNIPGVDGDIDTRSIQREIAESSINTLEQQIESEKTAHEKIKALQEKLKLAKINAYKESKQQIVAILDELVQKEQEVAKQIKSLNSKISTTEFDLKIRGMEDSGLPEYRIGLEKAEEARRLFSKSQEALNSGDLKSAESYAKESQRIFADLSRSQDELTKITGQQGYQEAGRQYIEVLKKQKEGLEQNKQQTQEFIQKYRAGLNDINQALEVTTQSLSEVTGQKESTIEVKQSGLDEIKATYDNIQDKTVTITQVLEQVEKHAKGGLVGAFKTAKKFASGGHIPGFSFSDVVPAMLRRGEFVLTPESVRHYGLDFLYGLNNLQIPRDSLDFGNIPHPTQSLSKNSFATGGFVGGTGETMILNLNIGGHTVQTITDKSSKSTLKEIEKELNRRQKVGYRG